MSAKETPVAAVGSRREGRERILSLLYEAEIKGVGLGELIEGLPLPLSGYAATLVHGLEEDLSIVDQHIEEVSHHWKVSRMPAVDRALLRIATFELLRRQDVPSTAVISEAVELAAQYSTDASSKFVNGVLAQLMKGLRPAEPSIAQNLDASDLRDSDHVGSG